jgi:Mg-chelatase subunit ChlD
MDAPPSPTRPCADRHPPRRRLLGIACAAIVLLAPGRGAAQRPHPIDTPRLPSDVTAAEMDRAAREAGFANAAYPYHDQPNGCGPGDWRYHLVPDGPGSGVSFVPACNEHDYCYMGSPERGACDQRLVTDAQAICRAAGLPSRPRFEDQIRHVGLTLEECFQTARSFGGAVDLLGTGVHAESQLQQRQYARWLEAYLSVSALLFVFDVSGSMTSQDRHRINLSAAEQIITLRMSQPASSPRRKPAGVMVFGGDCSPAAVRIASAITSDLAAVKRTIQTGIPAPSGGTPLSIATARADQLAADFQRGSTQVPVEVDIILLSDGEDTCGGVRPTGVYAAAAGPVQPRRGRARYMTVGLGVAPGSAAERDLQYLATSTGGRYLSASSPDRLRQVFTRHVRTYVPRRTPFTPALDMPARQRFLAGAIALQERNFRAAADSFAAFAAAHPGDAAGHYNLAQALEATDRYRGAAAAYRRYLAAAPGAADRAAVQAMLPVLERDHADHYAYQVELIRSDLAYLESYYQRLFNQDNASLAAEFRGFVLEKGEFYAGLSDALEIEAPWVEAAERDVGQSIRRLARRVDSPTFDRDAVSLLAVPIGHLEELVGALSAHRP